MKATTYGLQWDKCLHEALWAYRNAQHMRSHPFYYLRQPMEAAFSLQQQM